MENRLTILGAKESGIGAAILAVKQGFSVFVSDNSGIEDSYKSRLNELGVEWEENGHTEVKILKSDLVIKSPGIPDKVEIIKKAKEQGLEIISEPEFASRYFDGKIIAITGTNGKTTTSLLTHHLLKECGFNVALAGNIGNSVAQVVAEEINDYIVLEISSFQIDGINSFKPFISVILNITPDHLDRYDYDIEKYAASKISLSSNQDSNDHCVYNYDDFRLKNAFEKSTFSTWSFSLKNSDSNAYYNNETFSFNCKGEYNSSLQNSPLIGRHNSANIMAAFVAAHLAGAEYKDLENALGNFKNAEHRLEKVEVLDGITYINDSKATNVNAVYYALEGISSPIIWIAGGVDKGNDYTNLFEFNNRLKALLCLGKDNEKLKRAYGDKLEIVEEFTELDKLIYRSREIAESGDVVLLSPACASFDLFKNYEDRGRQFKSAVRHLKTELEGNS